MIFHGLMDLRTSSVLSVFLCPERGFTVISFECCDKEENNPDFGLGIHPTEGEQFIGVVSEFLLLCL